MYGCLGGPRPGCPVNRYHDGGREASMSGISVAACARRLPPPAGRPSQAPQGARNRRDRAVVRLQATQVCPVHRYSAPIAGAGPSRAKYVSLIGNARVFGGLGGLAAGFRGLSAVLKPAPRPLGASWRRFRDRGGRSGGFASGGLSCGLWRGWGLKSRFGAIWW